MEEEGASTSTSVSNNEEVNPPTNASPISTPSKKTKNRTEITLAEDDIESCSDSLLSLSFNQDGGCLAVGTTGGFRIYNVHPFQETFRRSVKDGIGSVEMLFRCNLLALVGGGPSPRYPPNKAMIWDDHRGRCIGELSFRQRVLSVRLRRDRVAVALMDRVYVYNFSDLTLLDQIHTASNPLGLLSLSPDVATNVGMVLACPSINRGGVRVELYGCRKTVLIDAHETGLAALALSMSGTLLATASERGTIVRLFSTKDKNGTLLRELRRGVERASIYCIAFSLDQMWLATTSDRGTAHIFYIGDDDGAPLQNEHVTPPPSNSETSLSSIFSSSKKFLQSKRILWEGEGSYAQVRGIDDPVVCAFVPDRPMTLAIVGKTDGCIMMADYSEGPGEAKRIAYHRFIRGNSNNRTHELATDNSDVCNGFNEDSVVFSDEDGADGFITVETAIQTE